LNEIVLGIVADTHVPDRVQNLHPALMKIFINATVNQILHAGDVCDRRVIQELSSIAPVTVVQGNRDWMMNGNVLPMTQIIEVNGRKIGLMHGHGDMRLYVLEKFYMLFRGYQFKWFRKLAVKTFPEADVIVFGHSHRPENVNIGNKLIFNPGSAAMGAWGFPISCGIIKVQSDGQIEAEIIELTGAERKNGKWNPI
jgi:putative phosphoesterase